MKLMQLWNKAMTQRVTINELDQRTQLVDSTKKSWINPVVWIIGLYSAYCELSPKLLKARRPTGKISQRMRLRWRSAGLSRGSACGCALVGWPAYPRDSILPYGRTRGRADQPSPTAPCKPRSAAPVID